MLEKTIDCKDISTSMESQSSQQSIQKMMKQAMGKQPLRQTTDEVSLASWASSSSCNLNLDKFSYMQTKKCIS